MSGGSAGPQSTIIGSPTAGATKRRRKSARGAALRILRQTAVPPFDVLLANAPSLKSDERVNVPARALGSVWCSGLRAGLAVLALGLTFATSNAQSRTVCMLRAEKNVPLRSRTPIKSAADIPIWKTITLGAYPSVDTVRSALDNSPCPIGLGDSVDEAIGRPAFPFTKTKLELDLVIVSAADLGFSEDGGSIIDIYKRAKSIGLGLCPPDLGPALRLIYQDQPRGEFLHIAMPSVTLYSHELVDFSLGNDGSKLLIIGGDASPKLVLSGAVRFIFVRPRPDAIAQEGADGVLAKH